MQVICMRRKTTQKKESKKNKRTLNRKDPRLGPCGPERILGGFGVLWGVILGAKGRPKWLQNSIKQNLLFLDRSWKRSGAPKGGISEFAPPVQGPRGGVKGRGKPLLQGRG